LKAGEACVIFRVQVDAEYAGQQDAVSHLERAQLHVAKQFVDDRLAAEPLRGCLAGLRHL
jgi:hypothetical protein